MASTTTPQLISPQTWLLFSKESPKESAQRGELSEFATPPSTISNAMFPISHLPYELRQQIYCCYIASLPVQTITCNNARLPHHALTSLYLASSFLQYDLAPISYYHHATFGFSCPEALETFASCVSEQDVRSVKITYVRYDQPSRDWVYLLMENFPGVEEVTFSVERVWGGSGARYMCFENWWRCVKDAVREGLASAGKNRGKNGKRALMLRVEDGGWGMREAFCS